VGNVILAADAAVGLGRWLLGRGIARAGVDIVGKVGHTGLRPTQLSVDRSIVERYAAQLRAGQKLDPIHAVEVPSGQRYIIEGHHRYVASQQTGIPVEVVTKQGAGPVGFDWKDVIYETFVP
jgi:ParB-like chromosome segregation protein Spo0J